MKTITEFTATTLKNASKTQQDLQTAGKTAEELPQALGEALKLEGDKLTLLLNALSAFEGANRKGQDLKRVVVLALTEGEKAPTQGIQKGDHYFAVEFYPPLASQKPVQQANSKEDQGRRGKRDRDGKKGDKKGGKPPRRDDNNRGPRPAPRGPRVEAGAPPKIRPVVKTESTPTPNSSNHQ